jgi:hypothetical protein
MIMSQASQETMRNSFTIIVGKYEGRRVTVDTGVQGRIILNLIS